MRVEIAAVEAALEAHGGKVPRQPKLEISFENVEDGWGDMVLSSPHASPEAVLKNLGIRMPPEGLIRKHTPSTRGFVASEPGRPHLTAAATAGADIVSTTRPSEAHVSSEPSRRSRIRRSG